MTYSRTWGLVFALSAGAVVAPSASLAQETGATGQIASPGGLTLEVGGGASIGSHSASAANLETAMNVSYHAALSYRLSGGLGLFGGYYRTAYGCENGYCRTVNPVLSANHGVAGVEFSRGSGWFRLGAAYGSSKGTPSELTGIPASESSQGLGGLLTLGSTLGSGVVAVRPYVSYLYYLSDDATAGGGHGTAFTFGLAIRFRVMGG